MMPLFRSMLQKRESLNDPNVPVWGTKPARHFLDVLADPPKPTMRSLVQAILDTRKWSIATLSKETGIHSNLLSGVLHGTQAGFYPGNQKKLMTAVNGVPALVSLYRQTNWGKAQTRRTK